MGHPAPGYFAGAFIDTFILVPRLRSIRPLQFLKVTLSLVLIACAAQFVVRTWPWPLVGDATLMRYVVFLMRHGMAPYRDIIDMNMPGSYLAELLAMHLFGAGAMGLRLYDFALLAVAIAAMLVIAWPVDWFAGLYAGVLLLLIHGRDGVAQGGQRDLIVAVLMLAGYALQFHALRSASEPGRARGPRCLGKQWLGTMLCGVCLGAAATIKPTFAPLGPMLLGMTVFTLRRRGRSWREHLYSGILGLLLPVMVVLVFLWREHAVAAFVGILRGLVPYHATIDRQPMSYFLTHSIASLLLPLAVMWLVLLIARKVSAREEARHDWEEYALLIGFVFGVLSLAVQGKGYPYHRYPSEAFLLLMAALESMRALRSSSQPWRMAVAVACLGFGALWLAPASLAKAAHYDWRNQEFSMMLQADLNSLDGAALSGRVQCSDTTAGCMTTLYRMQLVQSTGTLYDCYLFATPQTHVTSELRETFKRQLAQRQPDVFVVTNQECLHVASDYRKLSQWPEFQEYLEANYRLYAERLPTRRVTWWSQTIPPFGYRIYIRKGSDLPLR